MRKWLIGSVLLLAGCAHQITLIPQDGGPFGRGTVPAKWFANAGEMSVALDGKIYSGEYVFVPQGGTLGTGVAFSGTKVATGTFVGAPMGGGGRANLRADDGSTLRCEFTYSEWSATGVGGCEDGKGRKFDLTIK